MAITTTRWRNTESTDRAGGHGDTFCRRLQASSGIAIAGLISLEIEYFSLYLQVAVDKKEICSYLGPNGSQDRLIFTGWAEWTPSTAKFSPCCKRMPPSRLPRSATVVGLSSTPCWKRIQRLEADGVIQKRVALVDQDKIGLGRHRLRLDRDRRPLAGLARPISPRWSAPCRR